LHERAREIYERLGELRVQVVSGGRGQSVKQALGALAGLGGLLMAPPTGGASFFVTGIGILLWADGVREDAEGDNLRRRALSEARMLKRELAQLEAELEVVKRFSR
jgi:hypothetical protein